MLRADANSQANTEQSKLQANSKQILEKCFSLITREKLEAMEKEQIKYVKEKMKITGKFLVEFVRKKTINVQSIIYILNKIKNQIFHTL